MNDNPTTANTGDKVGHTDRPKGTVPGWAGRRAYALLNFARDRFLGKGCLTPVNRQEVECDE